MPVWLSTRDFDSPDRTPFFVILGPMKSDLDETLTGRMVVIVRCFLPTSGALIHRRTLQKTKMPHLTYDHMQVVINLFSR